MLAAIILQDLGSFWSKTFDYGQFQIIDSEVSMMAYNKSLLKTIQLFNHHYH
jgi:hypothetical protein